MSNGLDPWAMTKEEYDALVALRGRPVTGTAPIQLRKVTAPHAPHAYRSILDHYIDQILGARKP